MGRDITLTSRADGFELGAYHAPFLGQRKGGLVLVQEIFGVNANIRALADDWAREGFEVIAPSFYDRVERGFTAGYEGAELERAKAAMGAVDWTVTTGDLQTAIDALEGPVFVAGYCWGGAAAWVAACRCEGVTAAASFYGRAVVNFLDETPRCPVILHYGALDATIPLADVEKVRAAAKPGAEIHVYDQAGHGFFSSRRTHYHEPSAALAKVRTLGFFEAASA